MYRGSLVYISLVKGIQTWSMFFKSLIIFDDLKSKSVINVTSINVFLLTTTIVRNTEKLHFWERKQKPLQRKGVLVVMTVYIVDATMFCKL